MFTKDIQNNLRQTLLKMGFVPDPDFESSDPDKPSLICYSPYIEFILMTMVGWFLMNVETHLIITILKIQCI